MSGSRWSIRGRGKMRKESGQPVRSMSQPNDLDEIGKRSKKGKGILYYFQPWKWKNSKHQNKGQINSEEQESTEQDSAEPKSRRNSGRKSLKNSG